MKQFLLAAVMMTCCSALASAQGPARAAVERAAKPIVIQPNTMAVRATVDSFILPVKGGWFREVKGQVHVDLERPERSRFAVTVNTRAFDAGGPRYNAFLSGPAILNVAQYPEMTFVSRAMTRIDERRVRFDGNLTLRGVTRPLSVVATIAPDDRPGQARFTARGRINRLEFGIDKGYPLITAMVDFVLTTQPPAE
ncbi:YceI family protein [Methylocella sp. CPCC 101449]|uniref:YceI family protein n=1 Tax=Methylocella sp. CPCC 101449 TaxID=2987531 RepID=UPI00288F74F1|nr:YceI family protein [Methylocella sp. CPCC 101449]MDT2020134.1 YceI family protein [Methylocella sp. CPCC 101449]